MLAFFASIGLSADLGSLKRGGKFDDEFRRLWLYYLAYCEAGFNTGRIDVGQFVLTKPTQ